MIQQTRALLYQPDDRIRDQIERLTRRLDAGILQASEPHRQPSARMWRLLGIGYFLVGDMQLAEQALQAALRLDPKDVAGRTLAQLYLERAMALRRTSLGLATHRAAVLLRAASLGERVLKLIGHAPESSRIERDLTIAYRAVAQGQRDRLRRHCEAALARHRNLPGSEQFAWLLATTYSGRRAMILLSRAAKIRPHYGAGLWMQAFYHMLDGKAVPAARDVAKLIRLLPRYAQGYFCRAWIHFYQLKDARAFKDMNLAIELAPGDADARIWRAGKLAESGDLPRAMADYDEAIRLEPNVATHYLQRGLTLRNVGDLPGALRDFDKSLGLRASALGHAHRAAIRWFQGDRDGSLQDCNQAIIHDAGLAMPYGYRGLIRFRRGDLAGALVDCGQAIKLDGNFGLAYRCRGRVRTRTGDSAGAIQDLTRALQLLPNKAPIFYYRGQARQAAQDLSGAIRDYSFAIALDPALADAYQARGAVYRAEGDDQRAARDFARSARLKGR